ncbi:MAG: hypothetical protein WBB45_02710 [Cyclobacteriaceae bacterium]
MRDKMLEYSKVILSKVSFNPALFQKELKKSLDQLEQDEAEALKEWVYDNFVHQKDLRYTLGDQNNDNRVVA